MFLTIDWPWVVFNILVVLIFVLSILKIFFFFKGYITKNQLFKLFIPVLIFVVAVLLAVLPLGTVQNVWILFLFLVGQWIFLLIQIADIIKTSSFVKKYFLEKIEEMKSIDDIPRKWVSFNGLLSAFFSIILFVFGAFWPLLLVLLGYMIQRSIDENTCKWFGGLICAIPFLISIGLIAAGLILAVVNIISFLIKKVRNRK